MIFTSWWYVVSVWITVRNLLLSRRAADVGLWYASSIWPMKSAQLCGQRICALTKSSFGKNLKPLCMSHNSSPICGTFMTNPPVLVIFTIQLHDAYDFHYLSGVVGIACCS